MIIKRINRIFDFFFILHKRPESNLILFLSLAFSFAYNIFWSSFLFGNLFFLSEKDVKTCENLVQINYIISVISIIFFFKTFIIYKFHNLLNLETEVDCLLLNAKVNQTFSLISMIVLSLLFYVDYGNNVHCLFIQYYDLIYILFEGIIVLVFFIINKEDLIKILSYKKLEEKLD